MKYYSEKLKKVFDTPEALEEAEKDSTEITEKETRKSLAAKVKETEKLIDEAYDAYNQAIKESQEIIDESNARVENIISIARQKIEEAEKSRVEAISKFNEKFGCYTTTYTGKKAMEEFDKLLDRLDNYIFPILW